jgi:hypothetical protein
VVRMSIYDEIRKLGFEFDHEYGNSEERMEVWVNCSTGMGLFSLPAGWPARRGRAAR